jgi:hypothetical protein
MLSLLQKKNYGLKDKIDLHIQNHTTLHCFITRRKCPGKEGRKTYALMTRNIPNAIYASAPWCWLIPEIWFFGGPFASGENNLFWFRSGNDISGKFIAGHD